MAKGRARRYTNTAGRTYIRLPYDESKGWVDASTRRVTESVARQLGFDGARSGRSKGSKNFSVRSKYYTSNELRAITQGINKAVRASGSVAVQLASPNIAGAILQSIHRDSKFNIYSGNLSHSYQAVIITGRKAKQIVGIGEIADIRRNNVEEPDSGVRFATLQQERHPIRAGKSSNVKRYKKTHKYVHAKKKRYLKSWEKSEGYAGNRIHTVSNKRKFGFYQLDKGKLTGGRIQSAIIVENIAPYAEMVHLRFGNVLRRGVSAKTSQFGTKLKGMYRIITMDVLKKAGFTVK